MGTDISLPKACMQCVLPRLEEDNLVLLQGFFLVPSTEEGVGVTIPESYFSLHHSIAR
jgi:hypothetical protein